MNTIDELIFAGVIIVGIIYATTILNSIFFGTLTVLALVYSVFRTYHWLDGERLV